MKVIYYMEVDAMTSEFSMRAKIHAEHGTMPEHIVLSRHQPFYDNELAADFIRKQRITPETGYAVRIGKDWLIRYMIEEE